MVAGTIVLTAAGALPVEYLSAADRIVTRSGLRALRGVTVTVLRRAAMVRIGVDTLGIGQPAAEVVVSAGQQVMIRDWRAQTMFGAAQALIPARLLVDGHWIRAEAKTDVRLFALKFETRDVVYAGGLELGCAPQRVTA